MVESHVDQRFGQGLNKKIEAAAWGLFFIWVGIAVFAHVGWAEGLIGAGIITLGAQAARKYFQLRLEGFWIALGSLFVVGGIWRLFDIQIKLLPIVCLIAGAALVFSALAGRAKD